MSECKKQTESIASAWMSFDKQWGLSNSVTNSAVSADFSLLKEQH
jgi:hypothetical protein